jgi:hypothetical protein
MDKEASTFLQFVALIKRGPQRMSGGRDGTGLINSVDKRSTLTAEIQ